SHAFRPAKIAATGLLALALSACATGRATYPPSPDDGRGAYKVGQTYTIAGQTYTPHEDFSHREEGNASWYGPGFHGKRTANGEVYNQNLPSAAHRTLPMPSVVRVTNLDNGASVVVRVNDRGPFAHSRVIDVSRAAAVELDMIRSGTARVRVEIMERESRILKDVAISGGGPADQMAAIRDTSRQPSGGPVTQTAPRTAAPQAVAAAPVWSSTPSPASARPAPAPAAAGAPAPSVGTVFVQAGAFASINNAERVRATLASYGESALTETRQRGQAIYRVRLGPYGSVEQAEGVRLQVVDAGHRDARIVND
ncbi:MAG: septal ring lytic transglycosylase RlpA family protein, partial [Rhodospirillales bacterium]|nr:septal ring lytic transglycosylase RlpA family protein [Rhodospirillales bacterium]